MRGHEEKGHCPESGPPAAPCPSPHLPLSWMSTDMTFPALGTPHFPGIRILIQPKLTLTHNMKTKMQAIVH